MATIVKTMPITSYGTATMPLTGGQMPVLSDNPLYAIRRRDLYRLADAWGVEYSKDAPATEMRQLLMSRGIDGSQPSPRPVEAKPKADIEATVLSDGGETYDSGASDYKYEDMKFFDLRKLCKERGIEYSQKTNKAALIEKLKDADFYGENAS